jgi:hypothetical protein
MLFTFGVTAGLTQFADTRVRALQKISSGYQAAVKLEVLFR